jgi:transposase-like protein
MNKFTRNFDMETATFANRKLIRLAALLYILRRKRHRSIQRKKLYLRVSSVLLNTSILAIYGLWKSNEIVLLTNRRQYVLLTDHSHYVCPSLRSTRLVRAGEERASLNKRQPKCLWLICSSPKNLRKSFPLVNLVNGSNYVTQMSTIILLAYRKYGAC